MCVEASYSGPYATARPVHTIADLSTLLPRALRPPCQLSNTRGLWAHGSSFGKVPCRIIAIMARHEYYPTVSAATIFAPRISTHAPTTTMTESEIWFN
ncbi:hypothetical protein HBI56_002930 [Parastagonospora nodorum]|nr:hypothetical protein HBH52_151980 [Parastagonospora nodorum]KAH3983359.1 hypothetical protein HBH51_034870 [Parastagonospora nodorum]KAH4032890.1 hypothetical protein HBI13_003350 [Parastagonospora nodorum]KAH4041698.1 hypothetical protein HBI09_003290 [Parastagonospora nodorum]KAH4099154.1 hypothetical protein HBH48_003360 [Parastagonospora nodorum]